MYRLFWSNEGICDLFCYSKVLIFHIGEVALIKRVPKTDYFCFKKKKDKAWWLGGNVGGEYYRGLLIYCFAFDFGPVFSAPFSPVESKAAPSFSHT
jgi:hypothetical protein